MTERSDALPNAVIPTRETWQNGTAQAAGWMHLGNAATRRLFTRTMVGKERGFEKGELVPLLGDVDSGFAPLDGDPVWQGACDGLDPMSPCGRLYAKVHFGPAVYEDGALSEYPPTEEGEQIGLFALPSNDQA